MRPGRAFRGTLLGLLSAGLICGCASSRSARHEASADGKLYAVTTDSTPFYQHSPQQGRGPDKTLVRDTPVKLVRPSFGFCKVQLLSGEVGFITNADIGPATGKLVASTSVPEKPAADPSEWRAEIPQPRPATPEPSLPEFEPTPFPSPQASQ